MIKSGKLTSKYRRLPILRLTQDMPRQMEICGDFELGEGYSGSRTELILRASGYAPKNLRRMKYYRAAIYANNQSNRLLLIKELGNYKRSRLAPQFRFNKRKGRLCFSAAETADGSLDLAVTLDDGIVFQVRDDSPLQDGDAALMMPRASHWDNIVVKDLSQTDESPNNEFSNQIECKRTVLVQPTLENLADGCSFKVKNQKYSCDYEHGAESCFVNIDQDQIKFIKLDRTFTTKDAFKGRKGVCWKREWSLSAEQNQILEKWYQTSCPHIKLTIDIVEGGVQGANSFNISRTADTIFAVKAETDNPSNILNCTFSIIDADPAASKKIPADFGFQRDSEIVWSNWPKKDASKWRINFLCQVGDDGPISFQESEIKLIATNGNVVSLQCGVAMACGGDYDPQSCTYKNISSPGTNRCDASYNLQKKVCVGKSNSYKFDATCK